MKHHVPYRGAFYTRSRWSTENGVVVYNARWQMYRAYLQLLRLIPDPHLWAYLQPRFRKLCAIERPASKELPPEPDLVGSVAEIEEAYRVWRLAVRNHHEEAIGWTTSLSECKKELNRLRAAVATHPHALLRLIQDAYGQTPSSPLRKELLWAVSESSPPEPQSDEIYELLGEDRTPIPAALEPLAAKREIPNRGVKIRTQRPYHQGKAQNLTAWQRRWSILSPPIYLPKGSGVSCGWEDKGIVVGMRALAGVGNVWLRDRHFRVTDPGRLAKLIPKRLTILDGPHQLPTFQLLSPIMRRIFPIKITKPTLREPPYPQPERHETRNERHLWAGAVPLTSRILRTAYESVWLRLNFTRPVSHDNLDRWVKCSYEEMKAWEAGEDIPASSQPSSGSAPTRPHKFGTITSQEEEALRGSPRRSSGVEDTVYKSAGGDRLLASRIKFQQWQSTRLEEMRRLKEPQNWLFMQTTLLRWMARWEQMQQLSSTG
ncbi:hypothetical protein BD324DRAFT_328804 [Kockovaella imperatae]|uniref:Uncharacterized protein n=1 Tax=Kockovaella imperatae TaxID=4999 RepID=A0A1Y1UMV9_9TREE|nr:hypothetical protein BD324DRAFT_328804 [Kockovaella imperatae]ORX39391.1 hypothetical protein BD324DRAFT_328804 [Kockovaella imperatae]